MENIFYGLIVILLLANLYFVTRKETEEDNKDDEYLIKGIVSEIIENEESQIYKLLNRSDQTVKDFLEKTGEIKSSITGVDQQTRNLISVLNNNQSRGQWAESREQRERKRLLRRHGFLTRVSIASFSRVGRQSFS